MKPVSRPLRIGDSTHCRGCNFEADEDLPFLKIASREQITMPYCGNCCTSMESLLTSTPNDIGEFGDDSLDYSDDEYEYVITIIMQKLNLIENALIYYLDSEANHG